MANIERLQQLRRVVMERPDELFDMSQFGKATACGTVACAVGSAALDPWFLANTDIAEALPVVDSTSTELIFDLPCGMDARLASIFWISEENVSRLFYDDTTRDDLDVTKDAVVANIDRLIAGQDAVCYGFFLDDPEDLY